MYIHTTTTTAARFAGLCAVVEKGCGGGEYGLLLRGLGFGDSWSRGGGGGVGWFGVVIRKMFERSGGDGRTCEWVWCGVGEMGRGYHAMEAVGCLIHLPRFDEADGGRGGGVWSGADEDGEVRI